MAKNKVDLVLGNELHKAISLLSIESEDSKIQDTIRELLLTSPTVIRVAKEHNIDLSHNTVERGGYRRASKIGETRQIGSRMPVKPAMRSNARLPGNTPSNDDSELQYTEADE